jgi:DNA-binding NarL/FixJ family response regulator
MRINVGIVEDDREVRENWVKLLNAHPKLKCIAACESGEEALKRFPDCPPEVVLMDINLPGMSGIQCTALLKDRLPRIQVLMVTVYSNNNSVFEALQVGASGYILKTNSSSDVIRSIIEVVEGGAPMTAQIARRVIEAFRKPAPKVMKEAQLTAREKEILQLIAKGYSNKEIASQINVGVSTVRTHIEHIYEKLHVHCRTEAAANYLVGPNQGPTAKQDQPNQS